MEQKPIILIFSTAYYPFVGGAEVAIKEIVDRLTDYDFEMVTALMDKKLPRNEQVGRVNVYRIGWGIPKVDKLYLALFGHIYGLKLHVSKHYRGVWAMMASFGGFAALSFKLRTKLPYLLTLQEGDPIEYILNKVKLVRSRFNQIFTEADGLQVLSTYLLNWGKAMGFKGKISEIVSNGVDISKFTKEFFAEEVKAMRTSFGFAENAIVVVTASRLVLKNGVSDVIKALKLLPENICFYVCGVGDLEASLKQLVTELGLEKRVNFAGYKSHDELPLILKASDIFIRPSLSEGLGNSFLEAMATGLVTIGTEVGGIPDFLHDGITGLICLPENPENIAAVIKRASEMSPEQIKIMHENSMKVVNEKYNWEYISERMSYIFRSIGV